MSFKKKLSTVFALVIWVYLFLPSLILQATVFAQEEFEVDANVSYQITKNALTKVTKNITLTNKTSDYYAQSYTVSFTAIAPQNVSAKDENGNSLKTQIASQDNETQIEVLFADPPVGKDKKYSFSLYFDDSSITQKIGEVWEVNIPGLKKTDTFNSYQVALTAPVSLGKLAYLSPKADTESIKDDMYFFGFGKKTLGEKGISLAFGDFQVFSFDLTYHIVNPLKKTATANIAIPPDTAYQKVIYEKISPEPSGSSLDPDGNWIASYNLNPGEKLDINATGSVQIFTSPREFLKPDSEILSKNTLPTKYWQTNDDYIKALAYKLVDPGGIYNYIVANFEYNLDRAKPNVERLGAKTALENPSNAICMEFTDAFVALTRAQGTPAREVNGYAYTQNPEIEPLSLVSDVLHSWAEYWDKKRQIWIPVDPTWGQTSGINYFDQFDLRHFVFVIHGEDDQKPYPAGSYKLGANPQKDVYVSFGDLPDRRQPDWDIKIEAVSSPLHPFTLKYKAIIVNTGPVAIYSSTFLVFYDQTLAKSENIASLIPYETKEFEVAVPFTLLGRNTPDTITVSVEGKTISIPTYRKLITITSLASVLAFLFVVTLLVYFKLRGWRVKHVDLPKEKSSQNP